MQKFIKLILSFTVIIALGCSLAYASEDKKPVESEEKKVLAPTNRAKTMNRIEAQEVSERSQMIKDLEKALGKPIGRDQQQMILTVVRANAEVTRTMHQVFVRSMGQLFEIRGKELREIGIETLKEGFDLEKDVIAKVEGKLGRKINQVERKIMLDLNDLRQYNSRKVHENISSSIAMITGIPQKRVMEIVPPVGVGRRR